MTPPVFTLLSSPTFKTKIDGKKNFIEPKKAWGNGPKNLKQVVSNGRQQ